MADIQTYKPKYRTPVGAPSEPINYIQRGALTSEFRATQQFADILGNIATQEGRRIYLADAEAQSIEYEAEVKRRMQELFDTYDTDADYRNYKSSYERTLADIEKIIDDYPNKITQRNAKLWMAKNKPLWEKGVDDAITKRQDQNIDATAARIPDRIKALNLTSVEGNAEASSIIDEMANVYKTRGYTEEQIKSWKADMFKIWDEQSTFQKAKSMLREKGLTATRSMILEKSIPEDSKRRILSDLYLYNMEVKAEAEQALQMSEANADQAVSTIYQQIIEGKTDISQYAKLILSDPAISAEDKISAVDKIKTFFTTWNSATKEAKAEIETQNSTRAKVERLISAVRSGDLDRDRAIDTYNTIARVEKINGIDSKAYIPRIFSAAEDAKNAEVKRREEVISLREKQVIEAIQKQPSFFGPDEIDEILKDFSNLAIIELRNKFDDKDITEPKYEEFKSRVESEANRLINKYKISEQQQVRAISARQLSAAENFKQQQDAIVKIIESLNAEGKTAEVALVTEEAIMLGLLDQDGKTGEIKRSEKKEKVKLKDALKRIQEALE